MTYVSVGYNFELSLTSPSSINIFIDIITNEPILSHHILLTVLGRKSVVITV